MGIAATAGQRRKLHGTLQQNHRQPIETTYEPELGRRADEVFIRYAGQGGAEPPAGIRASTFRKWLSAAGLQRAPFRPCRVEEGGTEVKRYVEH